MRLTSLFGMMLITALAPVSPIGTPATGAVAALDDGRLEPSWFGDGLEFRHADEFDYLWVRSGFSIEGRKVRFVPFGEVVFLGESAARRDEKDLRLAHEINPILHKELAAKFGDAFGKRLSIVSEGEDIRVEGRIVDCALSATITFMPVEAIALSQQTFRLTVDIRFVDAATGELLVGVHHRSVSDDFSEWLEDMADQVADDGFAKLYAKGKRVKK